VTLFCIHFAIHVNENWGDLLVIKMSQWNFFFFFNTLILAVHECYYHATNLNSIVLQPVLSIKFWF